MPLFADLDIEPFEDQSHESNRSEKELSQYLTSLYGHIQKRRRALPKHRNKNESETVFKPLYDYSKTKTTETDLRPSYHKFMENMESTNPELFQQLKEPLETEQLIDMNYLCLHENRNAPKVLPDSEYPDWVRGALCFYLSVICNFREISEDKRSTVIYD